jgi:hypothetical protein
VLALALGPLALWYYSSPLRSGGLLAMLFHLVIAEYDPDTERAYVEFRAKDDDDGEIITTTISRFDQRPN